MTQVMVIGRVSSSRRKDTLPSESNCPAETLSAKCAITLPNAHAVTATNAHPAAATDSAHRGTRVLVVKLGRLTARGNERQPGDDVFDDRYWCVCGLGLGQIAEGEPADDRGGGRHRAGDKGGGAGCADGACCFARLGVSVEGGHGRCSFVARVAP